MIRFSLLHRQCLSIAWPLSPCRQRRQALDCDPGLCFGDPQVMSGLQVQPELRAGAEEAAKAQGGVSGDVPLPADDLADPVAWYLQATTQLGRADG